MRGRLCAFYVAFERELTMRGRLCASYVAFEKTANSCVGPYTEWGRGREWGISFEFARVLMVEPDMGDDG